MCRVRFYRKNRIEREPGLTTVAGRFDPGELS
jgi:hypothetical protein